MNPPNVMNPGTWIVVGIILTIIIGAFIFLFTRFKKMQVPWKNLEGFFNVRFYAEGELDETFLRRSLTKAMELLHKHTKWKADQIQTVFDKACIFVKKDREWVDDWGRKVAGLDVPGDAIIVGSDLAALLHEMAHQVEEKVDKKVDYDHAGWASNGVRAAEDEFHTWLKS